jgi:hypothetical protein
MEPPINPEKQAIHIGLETQRGCAFKCHFCTYRTLTSPNELTVQDAVAAIINTGKFSHGSHIWLVDATATFPRERWREIMKSLAARGGAPHPLHAYARVSDVTDEIAMLMAAANVQSLFVGQESGDQRIIKAMRKGTDISHVRPCIEALGKSEIEAIFGFIHGFPGETRETMQKTRDLICHLNDGFEHKPVVLQYQLNPFLMQDMASISIDDKLIGQLVAPSVVADEMLATFIATAKVAHAPLMLGIGPAHLNSPPSFLSKITRAELFRWCKMLQRGVSMYLERRLAGKALDLSELKSIRRALIEPMTPCGLGARVRTGRVPSHLKKVFFDALGEELEVERLSGVGTLTRLSLFQCDLRATGRLSSAVRTLFQPKQELVPSSQVEGLASGLMDQTILAPKEWNLIRKRLRASQVETNALSQVGWVDNQN